MSDRHPRRILAMCLGGIGDTVLAFAALRELRRACPDDHVTALAMWPQAADLLRDLGIFDEVIQHNFQRESFWRSLAITWRLRRQRYDASILMYPTNRCEYNVLAYLIGAPKRLGHSYIRGSDLTYLRFLLTDRVQQQMDRHVVEENQAVVRLLAPNLQDERTDIRLGPLAPANHRYAERMLGHLHRPLLGIHPGCTTYKGHEARRWPAERFGELCRLAYEQLGLQPVVFGLPNEIDLKLQIQAACPQVYLAHGNTIRQTAALIARCSVFASNDSGLAHIASSLDVPVVMICGPTVPAAVRPYTKEGCVVSANLACSPCFLVGRKPLNCTHRDPHACLKVVSVEQVLEAVRACLDSRRTQASPASGSAAVLPDHDNTGMNPSENPETALQGVTS